MVASVKHCVPKSTYSADKMRSAETSTVGDISMHQPFQHYIACMKSCVQPSSCTCSADEMRSAESSSSGEPAAGEAPRRTMDAQICRHRQDKNCRQGALTAAPGCDA